VQTNEQEQIALNVVMRLVPQNQSLHAVDATQYVTTFFVLTSKKT